MATTEMRNFQNILGNLSKRGHQTNEEEPSDTLLSMINQHRNDTNEDSCTKERHVSKDHSVASQDGSSANKSDKKKSSKTNVTDKGKNEERKKKKKKNGSKSRSSSPKKEKDKINTNESPVPKKKYKNVPTNKLSSLLIDLYNENDHTCTTFGSSDESCSDHSSNNQEITLEERSCPKHSSKEKIDWKLNNTNSEEYDDNPKKHKKNIDGNKEKKSKNEINNWHADMLLIEQTEEVKKKHGVIQHSEDDCHLNSFNRSINCLKDNSEVLGIIKETRGLEMNLSPKSRKKHILDPPGRLINNGSFRLNFVPDDIMNEAKDPLVSKRKNIEKQLEHSAFTLTETCKETSKKEDDEVSAQTSQEKLERKRVPEDSHERDLKLTKDRQEKQPSKMKNETSEDRASQKK